MVEQAMLCPLCGRETLVRPARWHQCHYCGGKFLVPSAAPQARESHCRCAICGDLVRLTADQDEGDAVCTPCYDANLRGGVPFERPTVAPLVDAWPVRRRALQARDGERWPLTRGRTQDAL